MAPSINTRLSELGLYADDDDHVLICRRCGYALSVTDSQVTSHLRDKHQVLSSLRDGLTRYLHHGFPYKFRNPALVPVRRDGSPIHPMLPVYDGFDCERCDFRTINYSELSRH